MVYKFQSLHFLIHQCAAVGVLFVGLQKLQHSFSLKKKSSRGSSPTWYLAEAYSTSVKSSEMAFPLYKPCLFNAFRIDIRLYSSAVL